MLHASTHITGESMNQAQKTPVGRRALVLGASISGLLAARVLSEHFHEVCLLERDELPQDASPRKGTPHATHSHGLLAGGLNIVEELFPGLTHSLVSAGAVAGDFGLKGIFQAGTRRFAGRASDLNVLGVSRLTLEAQVRRRVLSLPNVKVYSRIHVVGLTTSENRATVTGVNLVRRDAQGHAASQETWSADLIIDATGRASHTPRWLAAHGYAEPEEERVGEGMPMNYVTAVMERRLDQVPDVMTVICGTAPGVHTGFVMIALEPDAQGRGRWGFTFGGYGDDKPPLDIELLRERSLKNACPEATRFLSRERLLGEPFRYQFAYSQRRHYEKLTRFPGRFLVVGDAMASFNPIYGQGMTVAACEALLLRDVLASGLDRNLFRRYIDRASAIVDVPWETAVSSDLALDFIPGKRTREVRNRNAFWRHAVIAAQHDPEIAMAFLRVGHFLAPQNVVTRPAMLARILWSRLKGDPPSDNTPPHLPSNKVQSA
jgi:2-polyprenyl-6-methoxyphenol hydroxylase-like FAD-dependent oxidoreductase